MIERARRLDMRVQGLELSPEAADAARQSGAKVVEGDIGDEQAVRQAFEGADFVLHAAARVTELGTLEMFRRVNVEGTRTAVSAAAQCGVRRFVHLSSVLVYGFRFPADIAEDGPLHGDGHPYNATKIESEQVVLEHQGQGGMRVIVLRPALVYGPGSPQFVVRPFRLMRIGLFMLINARGVMNHLYIDNLLDAVLLALEKETVDDTFNVSDGEPTTRGVYFRRLGRLARRPLVSWPARVMRPLVVLQSKLARLIGVDPLAEPSSIDIQCSDYAYSIDRARRQLGYRPRVLFEEGMQNVEDWLRSAGYIR
jgi:nucleoside-diphosphate-sugar epimerase